jgi:predicted acylesterase/phospholipase RssA
MREAPSDREKEARIVFSSRAVEDPAKLLALAKGLRDLDNNIEYARRVLDVARTAVTDAPFEARYPILHDLAVATYKSPDQPLDSRLDKAMAIVNETLSGLADAANDRDLGRRQDMLGIAGAIYKVRWSSYGLRDDLEKSLGFYRDGMRLGVERDQGYTAINAAFVLDLLASVGADTSGKQGLQAEAKRIREQVRDTLLGIVKAKPALGEDFWFLATLGEAYLGLRQFPEAIDSMERAAKHLPAPWQLESTARQSAKLASLMAAEQGIGPRALADSDPWHVVRALVGGNPDAARSFILGKVGLALSGGGFRASLFHIGVLARLAELDMLRHVEVISCVSGGSILGAFYYLELRKVLRDKPDQEIEREDYLAIVKRIEENFLRGVQKNIRMRLFLGFKTNGRVLTSRRSSMTERLAEFYDRELYDLVGDEFQGKRRSISDILIEPKGSVNFNPKYHNWDRKNKVPILVLNATTLNTCHNWQFTASFMGEPPARASEAEIEANDRLRRLYYEDAPPEYKEGPVSKITLSEAVAASACVPGFFDPLSLDRLYGTKDDTEQAYDTRLVDGGVYDNQGVASLLEQNATVLLVSDASGQTGVSLEPKDARFDVVGRANNILMARVREAQYQYLTALRDSRALLGLMYVHLKKELEGEPVDWLGSPDLAPRPKVEEVTGYGMRRDVQMLLAGIRTDLDAFSDCEADALMLSGYLMTRSEFGASIEHFPVSEEPAPAWRFLSIQPIAGTEKLSPDLPKLKDALTIAAKLWGKAYYASKALKAGAVVVAFLLLALGGYGCWRFWNHGIPGTVGKWLLGLAVIAAALAAIKFVLRKLRYRNPLPQVVASVVACVVGWIILPIHLRLIDPLYVRFGPKYRP